MNDSTKRPILPLGEWGFLEHIEQWESMTDAELNRLCSVPSSLAADLVCKTRKIAGPWSDSVADVTLLRGLLRYTREYLTGGAPR